MFSVIITAAAEPPVRVTPVTVLSSIQESFFTRSFDFEAISDWLWGLGAVALLLLFFIALKAARGRRVRYSPFGTITEVRAIRGILRSAFDQRRPFEIQFHADGTQHRPTLRCAPEYLGRDSLTLEANGVQSLSDQWIGRPATVFFRTLVANQDFTYYTFTSHVSGIHLPRQGICQLILPIPDALENRQKRAFLRIAPPKELLLGAALWCGESMPQAKDLLEITSWPKPRLLFLPGRMEQFQVTDISAGGARITIPNTILRAFELEFSAAERLLLMLDLRIPEQKKHLRFWMQCRIQNAWIEHAVRSMHLGVQFLSWARPKETPEGAVEEKGAGIEWLRLSSSHEVEVLGNWIMRRHLEMFRVTPI